MNKQVEWKTDPEKRKKLINKMIRLLQEGHRMLDELCPRCDAILFYRKDVGLRYCPNCDIFLASPEEIEKVGRENIRIIGEFSGGRVIEYEPTGKVAPSATSRDRQLQSPEVRQPRTGRNDVEESINNMIRLIIGKIVGEIDYELKRLSLKESFEILKLILEIRNLLRE